MMKAICIAVLSAGLALPMMAMGQNQQTTTTETQQTRDPSMNTEKTTKTTTTESTQGMTKAQMKAQRKQQKADERAAKDKTNALKQNNKATDSAEKAQNPQ
jgi:hypothetical protein